MRKNMLKKLFLSTTFSLILAAFPSFGMDGGIDNSNKQPEEILLGKASQDRKNFAPGNFSAIETFREFYRQHSHGKDTDSVLGEHHEVFVPYATYLLKTMNEGKQTNHILTLKKEVARALEDKTISAYWLIDAHFRYLTLLEDLSDEEKDILFHIPHNKYLKALIEKDLYDQPVVVNLYKWGLSLDRVGESCFTIEGSSSVYISKGVHEQINEEIAKHLLEHIPYPCLGEAVFPLELLINCWLDGIHLLGMPIQNIKKVHGADASPLGFAFHDLFHYKLDKRHSMIRNHILLAVDQFVKAGGFASDIIPHLVPLVVQKYRLVMEALKRGHEAAKTDKFTLVGEFYAYHEVPHFPETLLTFSNPADVVKTMSEGTAAAYTEFDAWENPEDILVTSPINGQSFLSGEEIKIIALQHALNDNKLTFPYEIFNQSNDEGIYIGYITDPERQRAIKQDFLLNKARFKLTNSPQFIDATFELPTGEKQTYTFSTLVRKWQNRDTSSLLKFAGFDIEEKPKLSEENIGVSRSLVLEDLKGIQEKIQHTIKYFSDAVISSFGEGPNSYAYEYAARYSAIDDEIKALVNKMLLK